MPKKEHSFDPEEVLSDMAQKQDSQISSRVESPVRPLSLRLFLFASLAGLVFFGYRVFSLTVLQGTTLSEAAIDTRERAFLVPSNRGAILDRDGGVIVDNSPSFALLYDPLAAKTDPEVLPNLIGEVASLADAPIGELQMLIAEHGNRADPLIVMADIEQELAVTLAAHLSGDVFRIEPTAKRRYHGDVEAFSNVIGYIGATTEEELAANEGYDVNEAIGKDGVERQYEEYLHGEAGERRVTVDAEGRQQGEALVNEPSAGRALRLTIDRELAEKAYEALAAGVRQSGANGGSAVILDPNTGALLAMANVPTYDPEELSGGISEAAYAALVADKRNPFLNRSIAGLYPPGSTLKPFVAAAALEEDVISPNTRIDASQGSITVTSIYDDTISWTFPDWKPHGFVDIYDALAVSSNVYFYTVGGGYGNIEGLGVDKLADYLKSFGFGGQLGIDIPGEKLGRIPTVAWKEDVLGESWYIGDTYNMAIGQGNVAATPLQLASATASIANGGTLWRPYVLDAVIGSDGEEQIKTEPTVLREVAVSNEELSHVRAGMRQAVTGAGGTNIALSSIPISSAAKTGTAQFGDKGKTHALVTAFAPYKDPELALAIVLDGGGQGTAATSVARDILEWYALRAISK